MSWTQLENAAALCGRAMDLVYDAAQERGISPGRLIDILEDFGGLDALLDWTLGCRCHNHDNTEAGRVLYNRQGDLDGALRLAYDGEQRRNGKVAAGSAEDTARV